MTRVIAGVAGGKRLAVPGGSSTRPTSDRAREGLFGTVLSEFGSLAGLHAADLYAGSGAVGLEALSRGAESVLLVESDARAAEVIRANIAAVGLAGARVRQERVERVLGRPADDTFDLVFADPPYAVSEAAVSDMLGDLQAGWLSAGALIVVERATRSGPFEWPPGYARSKSRRYGEATFWYGWYGSGAAQAEQAEQPRTAQPGSSLDAPPQAHEE
jgi:16S rRNA (guanine966-N2)-methyltransferase